MDKHLQNLGLIYVRPMAAFSHILDRGSLGFALLAALVGNFLMALARAMAAPPVPPGLAANPFYQSPDALSIGNTIEGLIPMALLFVPACIAISAVSEGLGSVGVIIRRDFMPLVVCDLMAWGAAFLLFGAVGVAIAVVMGDPDLVQDARIVGEIVFLILAGCAVRSTSGASVGHAIFIVIGGVIAMIGGQAAWALFPGRGLLFSPFLLIWIWLLWRPDFSSFTGGLRSRQRFQQNLEAATLNPNDADAHYQLGLIYQERRNYSEAKERFEKAIEIDPEDPDPIYQLGRIELAREHYEEARTLFERVAELDDKHSSSEVWRDLGATKLAQGEVQPALADLEKYTTRHAYDPEGQYWYGEALRQAGRNAEAAAAFKAAIDAGNTAPRHLHAKARKWIGKAQSALRAVQ